MQIRSHSVLYTTFVVSVAVVTADGAARDTERRRREKELT